MLFIDSIIVHELNFILQALHIKQELNFTVTKIFSCWVRGILFRFSEVRKDLKGSF